MRKEELIFEVCFFYSAEKVLNMEIIKTGDGVVYLWFDKTYSLNLKHKISKKEIEQSEIKRRIQELYPNAILTHDKNGAPLISGAEYTEVSISHYHGWYALYFSNQACGVDIQVFKDSLLRGKDYFVNKHDNHLELNKTNLHLIWSAKEALYKKYKGQITDLKNEVTVQQIKEHSIDLAYMGKLEQLFLRVYSDFVIVWT